MATSTIEDRRGKKAGRRVADAHVCIFHDDFKEQNLNCLIAIKDRIKIIEDKMSGTVTIKIAGIITTVAMGFLILFIGAAFNMMRDLRGDLQRVGINTGAIEQRIDNLAETQVLQGAKQENVLSIIAELKNGQGHIKEEIVEIRSNLNRQDDTN